MPSKMEWRLWAVTRRRFAVWAALGLAGAVAGGCGGSSSSATPEQPAPPPGQPPPTGATTFPLRTSPDARYLVCANGVPFPMLARTSWNIVNLTSTQLDAYLDNCLTHGYTGIEMGMLWKDERCASVPFANGGLLLPFDRRLDGSVWDGALDSNPPDFTTTLAAYWRHVDLILAKCEARGMLVFAFPAYVGYQGGSQGWMQQMVANGVSKMAAYGRFIGARYASQPNIVWMMGGDYGTPPNTFTGIETDIEAAMFDALLGTAGLASTQVTAEWDSESIASDQVRFNAYQTLGSVYTHQGYTATQMRRAYSSTPVRPAFLVESAYDEEGPPDGAQWSPGNYYNEAASPPERRFIWRGLLSGIAGYIQGNGYTWPFNNGTWESHLNSVGQLDLGRLNAFWKSIEWWRLVPDQLGSIGALVTAGGGTLDADDYVAASATELGDLLIAYIGPGHTGGVTIDMSRLRGAATARWFDPTSAIYSSVGPIANTGTHTFTPPGTNSAGTRDWLLRLDA